MRGNLVRVTAGEERKKKTEKQRGICGSRSKHQDFTASRSILPLAVAGATPSVCSAVTNGTPVVGGAADGSGARTKVGLGAAE